MKRFVYLFTLLLPIVAAATHVDRSDLGSLANSTQRVIGGEVVTPDSRVYKTTVRLAVDFPAATGKCSGTLIAKDLVVTAAHCVDDNPNFINVYIDGGKQQIRAQKWLAHPQDDDIFDSHTSIKRPVNDIALVKLSRSVGKGALIAQMPGRQMALGESLDMVVAGYGRTTPEGGNPFHGLHVAWTIGTMMLAGDGDKTDYQIEMRGTQACNGDSGGPIYSTNTKRLTVMGVTSHGNMNCSAGGRAISLRHHIPWLRKAAKQMGTKLAI